MWRSSVFGLSDEATEEALYDSQAIRRFVGIDLNREAAPDATTLLNFRHLLEAHQLTASIFNAINAHLAEKGLFLREGTIVDATLIAAPPESDIYRSGIFRLILPFSNISSRSVNLICTIHSFRQ